MNSEKNSWQQRTSHDIKMRGQRTQTSHDINHDIRLRTKCAIKWKCRDISSSNEQTNEKMQSSETACRQSTSQNAVSRRQTLSVSVSWAICPLFIKPSQPKTGVRQYTKDRKALNQRERQKTGDRTAVNRTD